MSADPNTGFLTKLGEKVTYEANKAVTDPNAKEYAEQVKKAEEEKKQAEEGKKKEEEEIKPTDSKAKRIALDVWNGFSRTIRLLFVPFLAIILSMFVANDMIVYAVPTRVFFFLFTFAVCYAMKPYCILLALFYLLKFGYDIFVNKYEDGPKQFIFPRIFALLPITTYEPSSQLGRILMWPFTYPTNQQDRIVLPAIMDRYGLDVMKSFPGLSAVKNMPVVAKALEQFQEHMEHLHDISEPTPPQTQGNATQSPQGV